MADLTQPVARPDVVSARQWHLPRTPAFYLQASIVVTFLAGSSAPTPLYAVYQAEWGFSPITTTIVFGIYAIAVLAALLVFGSLSDYVGRRPVLLVAIAAQSVAMVIFMSAAGVPELVLGRVVQGLSTGAAVGALGAGMLDLDRVKGTIANAVAPMTGTATGALASGLLVQFLPAPTHLVYLALLGVFAVQFVGVLLMAETSRPQPGVLASIRPHFGVPPAARAPFLVAVPALVAVWALAGLYGSLGPALVREVTGSSSIALGSLALFAIAASGSLSVLVLRDVAPRRVMTIGAIALLVGVGLTVLSSVTGSALEFFLGGLIAGVGFGGGFQGAVRTVVPLAEPHERAGLLSSLFVVSYLAMGLPAVIAGVLVVNTGGVVDTAREYGIALMVLAALALIGLVRPGLRRPAAECPATA